MLVLHLLMFILGFLSSNNIFSILLFLATPQYIAIGLILNRKGYDVVYDDYFYTIISVSSSVGLIGVAIGAFIVYGEYLTTDN